MIAIREIRFRVFIGVCVLGFIWQTFCKQISVVSIHWLPACGFALAALLALISVLLYALSKKWRGEISVWNFGMALVYLIVYILNILLIKS